MNEISRIILSVIAAIVIGVIPIFIIALIYRYNATHNIVKGKQGDEDGVF